MSKRKKAEPVADASPSTQVPPTKAPRKKTTTKKAASDKKAAKEPAPSSLTLRLHAPGMTALHRAGIGGLGATLVALERRVKSGLIKPDRVPGGWDGVGAPPWSIDETSITLAWGEPENAGEYLRRLFAFGFGVKGGLIDLPGTYREELSTPVRAELQLGLTLTFLQFGPHRALGDDVRLAIDPDGDGRASVEVYMRPCGGYLHQEFADKTIDAKSRLVVKPIEQPSAFSPGAVVRHNGFGAQTRIDRQVAEVIGAAFAAVGCLSLPINRGSGVLLVPDVQNVRVFANLRPRLTPQELRHCRVAGPSDASLQAALRLRSRAIVRRSKKNGKAVVAGILAMRLRPTQWNSKQKCRVDAIEVRLDDDEALKKFDCVLAALDRRIRARLESVSAGRGQQGPRRTRPVWFFADSLVRPLAADNLAQGRRWYFGISEALRGSDDSNRRLIDLVEYETDSLHRLLEEQGMTDDDELTFIHAIHAAMRSGLGRIVEDTVGKPGDRRAKPPQALINRWDSYKERLRLSLLNAKTAEQARGAVVDLLGRAGENWELKNQASLIHVHRILFSDDWRRVRDLALLAVVSYRKANGAKESDESESGVGSET